ncbi:MAG: ATP-binding protein [Rikenellaceae bacterium]
MVERVIKKSIVSKLGSGKAIIIMGARQVGKTTVLKDLFDDPKDVLWLNGDEIDVRNLLENVSSTRLSAIVGNKKIVVVDEAQRIEDIGLKLKLIADNLKDVQLIATGSSSFDLANKVNEPLTGRKWEYRMYPISFSEMSAHHGLLEEKRMLPHRLVYGYYPDVVVNAGREKDILRQLSESYLYKDILMWEQIKKPDNLLKLLQALAMQVGSQVSYNELGQTCGLDSKTVEKYVVLLEQTFVIFRLGAFSRNLRNELKRSRKIYFYDNGIRNALLANFSIAENRSDIGALWENFLISERMKNNHYSGRWANSWFWRTTQQKEIDYLEEEDGALSAFEFKWNDKAKVKIPVQFEEAYSSAVFKVITPQNVEEFLL